MSATKLISQTIRNQYQKKKTEDIDYKSQYQQKLIDFRKQKQSIVRIEKPSNLPRARNLGYKAKRGVFLARIRIRKGTGTFSRPVKGRRPKRMGTKKLSRNISIKTIAEKRVGKKFPNAEVLNSYYVGEDGKNKYYEVILVERKNPHAESNKNLAQITKRKRRAERGLTSAGKKSRGLRKKKK